MIWPVELTHSNECEKECSCEQSEKENLDLVSGTYSFEQSEDEFPFILSM